MTRYDWLATNFLTAICAAGISLAAIREARVALTGTGQSALGLAVKADPKQRNAHLSGSG